MKLFVLVVLSVFQLNKSLEINYKLTLDFLNYFNLNIANIFYCGDSLKINDWKKVVKSEFKYFSFFDVSSPTFNLNDSWRMMQFDYRQIGVVFDVTCNETDDVFDEFSRSRYFNASYNWLMVSDNYNNSIDLLRHQNINLDAEISLAVIGVENISQLYDIYNPNSRSQGKLVVQKKGVWNNDDGINITLTGSKFDRRSNLNGVFIHAGIVASQIPKHQTLEQYMEGEDCPLT